MDFDIDRDFDLDAAVQILPQVIANLRSLVEQTKGPRWDPASVGELVIGTLNLIGTVLNTGMKPRTDGATSISREGIGLFARQYLQELTSAHVVLRGGGCTPERKLLLASALTGLEAAMLTVYGSYTIQTALFDTTSAMYRPKEDDE